MLSLKICTIGYLMVWRITTLLLVLVVAGPVCSLHSETPANRLTEADCQGEPSRPAEFRVDFRVAVMAPAGTAKLRVWLPLAQGDRVQEIIDRQIETFPRSVQPSIHTEPLFGNTFAYFEFDSPAGAQLITHQFTARIRQIDWPVDYSRVRQPDAWPESFAPYQRIDPRTQEGEVLRDVLAEIRSETPHSADRLVNAMNWVDKNLTYDHAVASLSGDPMHGLLHRRGHCSDYHGLCSTLAQKIGFPSRVAYGLQMFDKASPSHCKLEVYLPPYGWVTYDLSETQKLVAKIATDNSLSPQQRSERIERVKQRTMRGFRENTWLQITRGTNYELSPPASGPVPLVRTIYAEADGQPLLDPDPSNRDANSFSWMTMYRVDGEESARRFQSLGVSEP